MTYGNGHYERVDGVWRYSQTRRRVPGARSVRIDGRAVLFAPELHPEALVSNEQAAALCQLTHASWRTYVSRGLAPAPVLRLAGSPFWTREVLRSWSRERRRARRSKHA